MAVCLDVSALLDWLEGREPALTRVTEVIPERPLISMFDVVAFHDAMVPLHGAEAAGNMTTFLRDQLTMDLPTAELLNRASDVCAEMELDLRRALAVMTAAKHDAAILTSDTELLERDDLPCRTEDLRDRTPESGG